MFLIVTLTAIIPVMVSQTNFTLQLRKHKKALITTGIIVVVYIVSIFLPIIGGYTAYPVAIARCGKLPVITSDFMAGNTYSEPGMTSYSGPNWLSSNKNYVCTTQEAEAQGYRKTPW